MFTLYDTFGFPDDLTEIVANERGLWRRQARVRRGDGEGAAIAASSPARTRRRSPARSRRSRNEVGATKFLGYEGRGVTGEGTVKAILVDGKREKSATAGTRVQLVFDQTPFYGESGGQTGDTGEVADRERARQDRRHQEADRRRPRADRRGRGGHGRSSATPSTFKVDEERRDRIRANHSATHLLHHALKRVLGDHVAQKGSLVVAGSAAVRLRALLADDRGAEAAGRGPGQRGDPREPRLRRRGAADRAGEAARRGRDVRREVRRPRFASSRSAASRSSSVAAPTCGARATSG